MRSDDTLSRDAPGLWSLVAGGYALSCAVALASVLGNPLRTIATVLHLPPDAPPTALAVPAAPLGTLVWWALVERRDAYGYLTSGVVGAATALSTVGVWVARSVVVWDPRVVWAGGILVAAVVAVTLPVGFVAGVPLMFARRRLGSAGH